MKFTSIRILLAILTNLHLHLQQMNVVTAFLYDKLDEGVYIERPDGFEKGNPEAAVCGLDRAVYGPKQAPRQWKEKVDLFFCGDLGMTRSTADFCLYVRHKSIPLTITAPYVEDLLIASNLETVLAETKEMLGERLKIKNLEKSRAISGMVI